MDHLDRFTALFEQGSSLLPLAAASLLGVILCLLFFSRIRSRLLIKEMRLEHAHQDMQRLEDQIRVLVLERDNLRSENAALERENAALTAECRGFEQQLHEREAVLEASHRQLEQRFEILAGEILTEKGQLIHQQNESALQLLLKPLHHQLQEFKHRVDDIYDRESRDRINMLNAITNLHQLNQQLSTDAANLTDALRGKSKTQGQWGEMILEKLLEQSGLRKGKEFETQISLVSESGQRRQPDVLVHLPGGRHIIIDAKVSLKAYSSAHSESDPNRRRAFVKQHLESVKKHLISLTGKRYHQLTGIDTVDFVLLFIPVEAAFQMVVDQKPEMLTTAMRRQVVLCSPSTLLATLRTIHHLWKRELQNRNGLIIAKQAGNLYDKLVGFLESFEELGMRLDQSRQAWEQAHKRLSTGRGNLLTRAESLKDLGVQPDRELAEVVKKPVTR